MEPVVLNPIATRTQNVDVKFTNTNQNMWGNFGTPVIGWHEYLPLVGTDFMQWQNGQWVDTSVNGNNYWTADDVSLVRAEYNVNGGALLTNVNSATSAAIVAAENAVNTAKSLLTGDLNTWGPLANGLINTAWPYTEYGKIRDNWNEFKAFGFDQHAEFNNLWQLTNVIYAFVTFPIMNFLEDGFGIVNVGDPGEKAWSATSPLAAKLVIIDGYDIWDAIKKAGSTYLQGKSFDIDGDGLISSVPMSDVFCAFVDVYSGVATAGQALIDGVNSLFSLANDIAGILNLPSLSIQTTIKWLIDDLGLRSDGQNIIDGIQNLFDNLSHKAQSLTTEVSKLIDSASVQSALMVNADVFARVGVQIDAELDGGSVDTDVSYTLNYTTQYDKANDTLTFMPTLINKTDGTAFTTSSPNAYLTAKMLYDVGALFDIYYQGELVLGNVKVDLDGNSAGGLHFKPAFSTGGTNLRVDISGVSGLTATDLSKALLNLDLDTLIKKGVNIDLLNEIVPYSDMFSSSSTGEFKDELLLFSLDSTGELSVLDSVVDIDLVGKASSALSDKIATLTQGMIQSIEVAIPYIQTQGTYISPEALLSAYKNSPEYIAREAMTLGSYNPDALSIGEIINDYYLDENFNTLNLDQVTSIFENATVSLGAEIQKLLPAQYLSTYVDENGVLKNSGQSLQTIIKDAASAFARGSLNLLKELIDRSYASGEFVIVDLTQGDTDGLFHVDTFAFNTDNLIEDATDPNSWENPLTAYQDPDINANTASFGLYIAGGESDPVYNMTIDVDNVVAFILSKVINVITGVEVPPELTNPATSSISIDTLVKILEVDPAVATEIKKYLDFNLTVEKMDYDVSSFMDFSQDFTLTVDEMVYQITLDEAVDASGNPVRFTFNEDTGLSIDNISDYDVDKNGTVDYSLDIVPTAYFSNDTELGYNFGIGLDFLRTQIASTLKLVPGLNVTLADYDIGPVLSVDAEINGLDIDMYESRFPINIGNVSYSSAFHINSTSTLEQPLSVTYADTPVSDSFDATSDTLIGRDDDNDTLTYGIDGGEDAGETVSKVGTYGTLIVTKATGAYTFEPNDVVIDHLSSDASESFTVTVNDGTSSSVATLNITINGVNENPIFTSNGGGDSATLSLRENSTVGTTLMATDADVGQTISYTISGGTDAALFTIENGALRLNFAPDYESPRDSNSNNTYEVTIQASDGNGGTDTQTITIAVADVDETPTPDPKPEIIDGAEVTEEEVTQTRTTTDENGNTIRTEVVVEQLTIAPVVGDEGEMASVPLFFGEYEEETSARIEIPTGVGVVATGSRAPQEVALAQAELNYLLEQAFAGESSNQSTVVATANRLMSTLETSNQGVIVNQLVLTTQNDTPSQAPIAIRAASDEEGGSPELLVIDASTLPAGTIIDLENVEFAVIVGEGITVRGGEGANIFFSGAGSQNIMLGADDDELHAGAGDDTVGSAGGNDQIYGEAGNDTVFGGEGSDTLHGGSGTDKATYTGNLSDYTITRDEGYTYVALKSNPAEVDTLVNAESIQFADSTYTITATTNQKQVATLYTQILDRQAEMGGYQNWTHYGVQGDKLGSMVLGFIRSEEYKLKTGVTWDSLDTAGKIEEFYQAILGRASDAGGKQHWINYYNSGATFEQVAEGFVDSIELSGIFQEQTSWNFTL